MPSTCYICKGTLPDDVTAVLWIVHMDYFRRLAMIEANNDMQQINVKSAPWLCGVLWIATESRATNASSSASVNVTIAVQGAGSQVSVSYARE